MNTVMFNVVRPEGGRKPRLELQRFPQAATITRFLCDDSGR